jgi:hypothetical protein
VELGEAYSGYGSCNQTKYPALTLHKLFIVPRNFPSLSFTPAFTGSRKMECQVRLDSFGKNFRYLGNLLRQTVPLPSQFIDDDLDSKISVTDFSLDSDIPFDADLQFFKPFPDDLMEESFKSSS